MGAAKDNLADPVNGPVASAPSNGERIEPDAERRIARSFGPTRMLCLIGVASLLSPIASSAVSSYVLGIPASRANESAASQVVLLAVLAVRDAGMLAVAAWIGWGALSPPLKLLHGTVFGAAVLVGKGLTNWHLQTAGAVGDPGYSLVLVSLSYSDFRDLVVLLLGMYILHIGRGWSLLMAWQPPPVSRARFSVSALFVVITAVALILAAREAIRSFILEALNRPPSPDRGWTDRVHEMLDSLRVLASVIVFHFVAEALYARKRAAWLLAFFAAIAMQLGVYVLLRAIVGTLPPPTDASQAVTVLVRISGHTLGTMIVCLLIISGFNWGGYRLARLPRRAIS